jgi:hypothetical protein
MTDDAPQPTDEPDPLDEAAADIDARSPQAAEDIEDLIECAEGLGRDPDQEVDPDADPR